MAGVPGREVVVGVLLLDPLQGQQLTVLELGLLGVLEADLSVVEGDLGGEDLDGGTGALALLLHLTKPQHTETKSKQGIHTMAHLAFGA